MGYVSACLLGLGRDLVGGGFGADVADGGVDDGVEERAVVGLCLCLDVLSGALAGFGAVRQDDAALLGRDGG